MASRAPLLAGALVAGALSAGALQPGLAGAQAKPVRYHLPEQSTVELRPVEGPGFEAARNSCLSCHAADYVAMQPPRAGPKFWEAEVTKMIKVYRAPIDEADAKLIAEYLAQAY